MSAARVMVLCLGLLAAPQTFAGGDPLEPINRPIHALNEGVDRIVLKLPRRRIGVCCLGS